MGRINKNDIIAEVSEEAYLSKNDAKAAVDATFDIIAEALKNGDEVDIANFGAFLVTERKERVGTNPETHEKMKIKARKGVRIRLSKSLKDKLNG